MTTAHDGDRELEWTGERYVPELSGNIRLEHVHRYLLAREMVKGQRVLDIACGEGYGADLLASVAAQVIGVDIVPSVIQHAHRRYRRPHLKFVAGSCTAIPLAAQSVDVVVSFETLEHHDQHDEMMREVRRVLRTGGLLIISSPDRREYSDIPGYQNPFHVRELYRDEFEALLTSHFRSVSLVGQRVRAGSIVGPLDAAAETAFLSFGGMDRTDRGFEGLRAPLYLIGVATDGDRPKIPVGLLDGGEFVWSRDQTQAVRGLLDQQQTNIAELAHSRAQLEAVVSVLRAELERHTVLVASLAADKARAEERSGWFQEEINRRGHRIGELDAALAQLQLISTEAHRALEEARTEATETRAEFQGAQESWRRQEAALEEARTQAIETRAEFQGAQESWRRQEAALEEARTQAIETRAEFQGAQESWRRQEAALATAIADHRSVQAALEARLTVMENSHSWRLTAPLRGLRQRMAGVASRLAPGPPRQATTEAAPLVEPAAPAPALPADAPSQPDLEPEHPPVPFEVTAHTAAPPRTRNRPSIVVVSHDAHFYGAQRVALFLARTLSRDMGYDVEILLCGEGPLKQQFAEAGRVHDFYSTASTPDVQARIIADLFDHGARLAICNTSCVGHVVQALKNAGFSIVSLIHEMPGLIGQYALEDSIATIAREADKVVFGAHVVRERFVELTGLSPEKAVVRPQGLLTRNRYSGRRAEARRALRARLGLGEQTMIALAVGSAHRRKGPDLFVETGLSVIEHRDDVAFVWVGHTDGDGYDEASARVSEAGAGTHFFFPGVIEDSDVFFAGADVYFMTSREDPFPSVVLHALDAELPVIGFDNAGGFVELLRRDCGILVPYLDTRAMAAAVLRMLAHPSEGRQLSAIGKEIVSREYDWTEYVHDLVMLAQGPRVSVIVPNYNYAHHLPARLRSILTQTYRPYEIVFLDDCSSDRSVEVAEELLGHEGIPFRIIRNDRNQGVYRQWLRGLQETTGDLVWIAEADDECSPLLVETLVPAFAQPNVVLAYCQSKQVDETGAEIAPDYLGWTDDINPTKWRHPYVRRGVDEVRDSLSVKNTIPNVSAVLMKKPDLAGIESELLTLRNAGDWLVYVHLLERGDIAYSPEPLNFHRRHSGSMTIGHGGLNLMRETLLVQRHVLDRHPIAPEVERKREACLQATYEYLGLNADGPAYYKDHEALRPLTVVAG